jgi:nitrile hydratase accessory protein
VSAPDAPVFAEPWQASAFAMVIELNRQGLFTWSEWAQTLGSVVHGPEADYYEHWLDALQRLVIAKGVCDPDAIAALAAAWSRAADATPHGEPIALADDALALAAGLARA